MAVSCNEKDFDVQNLSPDEFVSLLKNGTYVDKVGNELPNFSMNHIEGLINYLNDTTIIKEFPHNPISSRITHPKILNECIMWTIDGIRLGKKYPSLEPSLLDTIKNYSRLTNKELWMLGNNYVDWHNEFKINPSEALRKKDLLGNTTYKWN
ncbi:hypothetical protein MASR2M41_00400 [Flammeovirgaceae bacterium]